MRISFEGCVFDTGTREVSKGGRSLNLLPKAFELWIDETQVSRRHARIVIGESSALLEDLGSRNGTLVNGERIRFPAPLTDGHVITIGSASFVFRAFQQTASTASAVEDESNGATPRRTR